MIDAQRAVTSTAPQKPQLDTRRSWRVMRNLVVCVCAGAAALIGFVVSYARFGPGDSQARITEFESSLTNYINAAAQAAFIVSGRELDDPTVLRPTLADELTRDNGGHLATPNLKAADRRLVRAFLGLDYANQTCARDKFKKAIADYNFSHRFGIGLLGSSEEVPITWKVTPVVWMRCSGIAAAAAAGAGIAGWLFVFTTSLVWWFMMDRLRDIARAVKGSESYAEPPLASASRPAVPPVAACQHETSSRIGSSASKPLMVPTSKPSRPLPPVVPPAAAPLKKRWGLRHLFTPDGRITRLQWLARSLLAIAIPVPICMASLPLTAWAREASHSTATAGADATLYNILLLILLLVVGLVLCTSLAASVCLGVFSTLKRLHDFNLSGWWFFPFFGLSLFLGIGGLLLLVIPSTKGANRYGLPEDGGLFG